jgi:hypothetical protein
LCYYLSIFLEIQSDNEGKPLHDSFYPNKENNPAPPHQSRDPALEQICSVMLKTSFISEECTRRYQRAEAA